MFLWQEVNSLDSSVVVHEQLPMLYWLPKLHKRPYKAHFIANA